MANRGMDELRTALAAPREGGEELEPGAVLGGRFEVTLRLGAGGAGVVYEARDRLLGEDVALKVLHARYRAEGEQLERLRAEVRAARRIAHPNVCRVHDLAEHGGLLIVAMELLRGVTLRERASARAGGVSVPEAIDLVRQIGAGLAAAHRAGIVHCDVKPENVILAGGRASITDFGIARFLGGRGGPVHARADAATGFAEGTPAYMAPEQAAGGAVDERTDVYSLAALAFELLGGEPPFGRKGRPLDAALLPEAEGPPRLPEGRPAGLEPERRRAVGEALARGLAACPADRFEGVEALVAALVAAAGAGASAPFVPPPPGPSGEAARAEAVTAPTPAASTPGRTSPATPGASVRATGRARGVRRIVTVVHVLLEETPGELDEEEAAERAEALGAAAHAALVDAGGVVVSRGPGAILAAFGLKASRGDEPLRAADAARAVQAAAAGTSAVAVRIGIDTGRLVIRGAASDAPALSGDALARAARLAAEATPGEVRASGRSARHLARGFVLEPAGAEVVRVAARRRAIEAAPDLGPLVGRGREIDVLVEELAAVPRLGAARTVLVMGPAGIGKSRLRREAAELIASRTGMPVFAAAAEPRHVYASHAVLRGLLRDVLGLAEAPGLEDARGLAARALRGRGVAGGARTGCDGARTAGGAGTGGSAGSGGGASDDEPLVQGLAALLADRPLPAGVPALAPARVALARAASARPFLLVVEDAHWADDGTLELLEGLARGEIEAPIALLAMARPELLERRPRARASYRTVLELAPLPPRDAAALVAHHLRLDPAGAEARALAEASEGNPFFIEELARDALEGGARAPAGLPPTIEALIQGRLDRLGAEERDVLRAAAVLGRNFRRGDLVALLAGVDGAPDEAAIDRVLAALEARRIVFPLPPTASQDDGYALKHALTREVAYGELLAGERRTLHAAAARVLARRLEGDEAPPLERLVDLARHQDGAELKAEAAVTYRRAGDLAAGLGAPADARHCYERARALAGAAAPVELLLALGRAAQAVGAFDDAARVLDEAIARTERDPAAAAIAAGALQARALVARSRARWDEAVAFCRRGLELVRDEEHPVAAARLRQNLGWVLGYIQGDNVRGLAESLRAVEILERAGGDLAELAAAYSSLGGNYMRVGQWRDQLRCNERTLEIGERLGSLELRARASLNLGVNLMNLGSTDESVERSRRAIDLYTRMCATMYVALARNNLGFALVDRGDLDEAERELAEAERLGELCGGYYFGVELRINRARIAAKRGDPGAARAHAEAAVARAVEEQGAIDEGIARKILGAVLARAGDAAAAEAELDRAAGLLRDADLGEHARVLAERARLRSRQGRAEDAARLREEVRPTLVRLGAALDLARLEDDGWI